MKQIITAEYLVDYGFNEINDRDVDLDKLKEVEVKTLDDGIDVITKNDKDGVGTIYEKKVNRYGEERWLKKHSVDGGVIFQTEENDL